MEEEEELFDEKDIVNQEYYKGIKPMINCLICLNIVKAPVQCDKCRHYFCSKCVQNLSKCPLRCQNNKYTRDLVCNQLLSALKIKCQCGKQIDYDFLEKHKEEECEKMDYKKNYFKLKKKYELLKQQNIKNKEEKYTLPHSYFIKSSLHCHPIELIRRLELAWFCNICHKSFQDKIPSYHCTFCDFDTCYNCVKDKVTEGAIKEVMKTFY